MNIGLIAHDSKKILMQNFCIAYRGILCKHDIYATATTGRLVEEVTNINILPGIWEARNSLVRRLRIMISISLSFYAIHSRQNLMNRKLRHFFNYAMFTISRWLPMLRQRSCL